MNKKEAFYNEKLAKMQLLAKNPYYADRFAFLNYSQIKINQKLRNNSAFLNKNHITPFAGLMNDPNGLVFFKGYYYVFYQNVPQIAMHKTKLWSAYRTKDFRHFEDLGVMITPSIPEDWDGVFSGGGIVVENKLYVYYTGNTKKWLNEKDFIRGSATILCEFDEQKLAFKEKKVLFEVNKDIYTGDFRDPFPFYKKDNQTFYLFHGAQLKDSKKGSISIYHSKKHDQDFQLLGTLKINNFQTPDAYMYECPIYFELDGYDVLSFSTQGQKYFHPYNEKNDNVVFLIGKMDWETCEFNVEWMQHADLGFDFYACQTFNNTKNNEIIYLGWAAKPQDFEVATFDDGYAHHMNLPRKLQIKEKHLYQIPHFLNLSDRKSKLTKQFTLANNSYFIELNLEINKDNFSFEIENLDKEKITFSYENNVFKVDRSQMSVLEALETGLVVEREITQIQSLEIILDKSFIEIFINKGQEVFSAKYFIKGQKILKTKNLIGEITEMNSFTEERKSDKVILLPGEALIDKYKTDTETLEKVGGAPLNVCGAVQLLNQNAYFLGSIGDDKYGQIIDNFFDLYKLNKKYLQKINQKTTVANVVLDSNGERNFTFERGADESFKLNDLPPFDALVLSSATAFLGGELFETYNKLLTKAKQDKKIVFFDPNYRDALYSDKLKDFRNKAKYYIENSDVIKLSDEELKLIYGFDLNQIENLSQLKNKIFLITLGEKGTLVFLNGEKEIVPSIKAKVVDTTGAGDSFFGYFIAQFIEHNNFDLTNLKISDFKHIIKKANICASFVIGKKGAIESLPTIKEIEEKFNEELLK
ncbi:PfkB family carbohydrate kinase [Mycoplasmopsis glycophila]|uniref:beta-fructofuranosidase n=1 Tax=Mycoplasmopsis glycophila TaxID=171285 RepID=A0A449AUN4_9BACT|nr:PfkB family carbohydrate kinase [Mycoplasmopsis glycophila]VEU70229.1 Sucrose-6-phosphate hydrolase [Mycoplasmopsis glycophila]